MWGSGSTFFRWSDAATDRFLRRRWPEHRLLHPSRTMPCGIVRGLPDRLPGQWCFRKGRARATPSPRAAAGTRRRAADSPEAAASGTPPSGRTGSTRSPPARHTRRACASHPLAACSPRSLPERSPAPWVRSTAGRYRAGAPAPPAPRTRPAPSPPGGCPARSRGTSCADVGILPPRSREIPLQGAAHVQDAVDVNVGLTHRGAVGAWVLDHIVGEAGSAHRRVIRSGSGASSRRRRPRR